jgi:hypothetical protein
MTECIEIVGLSLWLLPVVVYYLVLPVVKPAIKAFRG